MNTRRKSSDTIFRIYYEFFVIFDIVENQKMRNYGKFHEFMALHQL